MCKKKKKKFNDLKKVAVEQVHFVKDAEKKNLWQEIQTRILTFYISKYWTQRG